MVVRTSRDAEGRFQNPDPVRAAESPADRPHVARWLISERPRRLRAHRHRGETLPVVKPRAALAFDQATEGLHVTWIGHATTIVRINGATYLLDPVWSERAGPGRFGPKRLTPPGIPWERLPRIDGVLLSHNHYDHMDLATLARLPRDTPILCPLGVGGILGKRGFTAITEQAWWEAARIPGLRATLVPAQHFSRRGIRDENRALWGGWVMEADGYTVYFAGDTGTMTRTFHDIGARFPGIDLAILPIGAYEPRWFMAPVHMDPTEAGEAFRATGATAMLPVHWGTFRLSDEAMDAPPNELERWRARADIDPNAILRPALGETLDLSGK